MLHFYTLAAISLQTPRQKECKETHQYQRNITESQNKCRCWVDLIRLSECCNRRQLEQANDFSTPLGALGIWISSHSFIDQSALSGWCGYISTLPRTIPGTRLLNTVCDIDDIPPDLCNAQHSIWYTLHTPWLMQWYDTGYIPPDLCDAQHSIWYRRIPPDLYQSFLLQFQRKKKH